MSWFPLAENVMESPEFRRLTPTEKLYYWWLVSQYNLRDGGFYISDLEFAITLGCNEKTIQRARQTFHNELEWIRYTPGHRDKRGRGLATQYHEILFTNPHDMGCWFAQQHRYSFEMMVAHIRDGRFQPADVVTYVYLNYWRWHNGRRKTFYITKKQLRELTNLEDAPQRIDNLYSRLTYNGGAHLFTVSGYQSLSISDWSEPCDPDESEHNREIANGHRQTIKLQVIDVKKSRETLARMGKPGSCSKRADKLVAAASTSRRRR